MKKELIKMFLGLGVFATILLGGFCLVFYLNHGASTAFFKLAKYALCFVVMTWVGIIAGCVYIHRSSGE